LINDRVPFGQRPSGLPSIGLFGIDVEPIQMRIRAVETKIAARV
jgi:hypothetical protein